DVLEHPDREGLRFIGGQKSGHVHTTLAFSVGSTSTQSPTSTPGSPAPEVMEMARLAAPMPVTLPSYNQIGVHPLRYLVGRIEGDEARSSAWVVGALPGETRAARASIDPATRALFPVVVTRTNGGIVLENTGGVGLEVMGFTMSFDKFRVDASFDG